MYERNINIHEPGTDLSASRKEKQIIPNNKNQKILDSVFTQRVLLIRRIIISTSNRMSSSAINDKFDEW